MANHHGSDAGGNGASKQSVDPPALKDLIQDYLDAVDSDGADDEAVEDQKLEVKEPADLSSDNKPTFQYHGLPRTTTGIVKIMRENGNAESADLMEELRQAQESAKQLLDRLKDLQRRKVKSSSKASAKQHSQAGS